MRIKEIYILKEAVDDLNEGRAFYNFQEKGIGEYFNNCIISDIESLRIYAGIHPKRFGFYQMLSRRFPYALYYEISEEIACVTAILPMRRDPAWISKRLSQREE
jgi:hypothetical protein